MPADVSASGSLAVQARDAASLAIVDTVNRQHFILMGRRRSSQVFMPGRYVLPGGALEAGDTVLAASPGLVDGALSALDRARLSFDLGETAPTPAALALAALRETMEETGRMIGLKRAIDDPSASEWPEAWQSFARANIRPSLASLQFLGRAITPPGYPRRFDARFFHVPAALVAAELGHDDGEFDRIDWLSLADARALDLHDVTAALLDQLEHRLAPDGTLSPVDDVPYMHAKHGTWTVQALA